MSQIDTHGQIDTATNIPPIRFCRNPESDSSWVWGRSVAAVPDGLRCTIPGALAFLIPFRRETSRGPVPARRGSGFPKSRIRNLPSVGNRCRNEAGTGYSMSQQKECEKCGHVTIPLRNLPRSHSGSPSETGSADGSGPRSRELPPQSHSERIQSEPPAPREYPPGALHSAPRHVLPEAPLATFLLPLLGQRHGGGSEIE